MNWKSFGKALRLGLISVLLLGFGAPVRAQPGSQHRLRNERPALLILAICPSSRYPGRDERLQINRVMDMLGIEPGKSVADIGAGSGWFTVRAARRVTGSGATSKN